MRGAEAGCESLSFNWAELNLAPGALGSFCGWEELRLEVGNPHSPVGTWIRTGERNPGDRGTLVTAASAFPRRDTTPKGCGGCSRDSRRPGSAPQLPTPALPLWRHRLGEQRRPAPADARAAGSRRLPQRPLRATSASGNFPVCLRLRSLLRFSELCRRGASWDLCLQHFASRLPGTSPSPGDPAPRRPNFSRAVCAPRLSSSCQGACWFFGGRQHSLPRLAFHLPPAWGWVSRDLQCAGVPRAPDPLLPQRFPSGIGRRRSRPLTPKLESTLVFSSELRCRRGSAGGASGRSKTSWPVGAARTMAGCCYLSGGGEGVAAHQRREIERQLRRDKRTRAASSGCCCWVVSVSHT